MFEATRRFVADGDSPMPWMGVLTILCAVVAPTVLAVSFLGQLGAAVFVASMPAHLAAKQSGVSVAIAVTIITGLGGVLALGSLEMALVVSVVLSGLTALAFRHGLAQPCLRALFTWTVFTGPIMPADEKPLVLILYCAAVVWSVWVTRALKQEADAEDRQESSQTYSALFGVLLGVGLLISIYVGARFFGSHGFWFPLTFVILWIPPFGNLFSRTAKRTAGTVAGVVLALILGLLVEEVWIRALIALAMVPVAFRLLPVSYVTFTALLTLVILEALSLVADMNALAGERLLSMFAAAVMALVLGAIGLGLLRWIKPEAMDELMQGG
ncbi:hypothetical protein ATO8_06636 [Roseivivax marinus]|uniref:Integral membrane bound transporter domain-containing protein n=1 Tax=Roseivivax marinus TaxID=1379903 RepID=W4HNI8_9RHOB|nr:FUSC family protein [Roseivivax marinus]ETW13686.1 hypothetical protein ATO8_06636 [Roseivivax marinus]